MSKILKRSYFWIDIVRMHYYFVDNEKDFYKLKKKFGFESLLENVKGKCLRLERDGQIIIVIYADMKDLSILAHEVTHASLFTFESIGQRLDYYDEFLPYLSQEIFSKCIEISKKKSR
jgi:hypothetical protein